MIASNPIHPFDPTSPLRGFLVIADGHGGISCSTFTTLNELMKIWRARKGIQPGIGLAHISFDSFLSGVSDKFDKELQALFSQYRGRLLITTALKYALPLDTFATANDPDAAIASMPVFLFKEDKT